VFIILGFEDNQIRSKNICPECGGSAINTSHEMICKECGLVLDKIFKESAYIFNNRDTKGNLSKQFVAIGNRSDFIGGLGTFIDYENTKYLKDKFGKLLPPQEQKLFRRLKKNYSQFLRIKNHETEYRIFNILSKISIYLNLNKNIRNNAAYYYKKIIKHEPKVINNISLIAFCIFYAARKENHNAPITINEISQAFQNFGHRVNPRLILRDGVRYKKYLSKKSKPHQSEDYLIRLINDIFGHNDLNQRLIKKKILWTKEDFQNKLTQKCRQILGNLTHWHRGGRNPFILTGAVIYLADKLLAQESHQKTILTQKLISEATSIAEYSIRDHYVNLLKPLFFAKLAK
jgi:transcription initiation factor TFIIIB Brf1 subunit/transcription initiation factor TFIIB